MNLNFSGKRALVTGASRGIGEAIAKKLLNLGCEVIITGTTGPPQWMSNFSKIYFLNLDLTHEDQTEKFCRKVKQIGVIDILVNNAGIHNLQSINDISDEAWGSIIAVNITGPMKLIRYFSRSMTMRRYGRIVNIGSIASVVSKNNATSYTVSKSGMAGLTRSAAIELAKYGVLVNCVSPGTTLTSMVENHINEKTKEEFLKRIPIGRFAMPDEIANYVVFLASELNSYMTGQNIIIDGGTTCS